MRRLCADLIRNLDLKVPAAPTHLFDALCAAMSRRHDKPVRYRLIEFPAETVSGLWVATGQQHLMLCEKRTAPEHQLVILGHEFWHLESHQGQVESHQGQDARVDAADTARLLAPALDAVTVERVAARAAARTSAGQSDEAACEYFGSLLCSKTLPWLATAADPAGSAPAVSTGLVDRLEASIGHCGSRRTMP